MIQLPRRLAAPAPGWAVETDVAVVGSGVAGLSVALRLARDTSLRVVLVTKDVLAAGSTRWAQGGIAAALGEGDDPDQHLADTLVAGAGLCDADAVRTLVREGPAAVRELAQIGARFDRAADGGLSLGREGGHHRNRIVHAGGDATGAEVERALVTRVLDASGVEVLEHAMVLDLLLTDGGDAVAGLTVHVLGEGARDGVGAVRARAVVLATGGIGQVYAATTNPGVSTGDGLAAALRAGAVVRDLEFVQFHPTVMWLGAGASGQQPLISEAVRGEGALLLDDAGERFMTGVHDLAELAPRDVVAKAIHRRMHETGTEHVWLDGRAFGTERWRVRFPTIYETLRSRGIDPVHDLVPVVPACHYASGGVRTGLNGETSIAGLFACGEAACTGVHGANRLASNSLLEGLVFGRRIADEIASRLGAPADPPPAAMPLVLGGPALPVAPVSSSGGGLLDDAERAKLQRLMSEHVAVLRESDGLDGAERALAALAASAAADPSTENWEATNVLTVASVLVRAARERTETRGAHWREDYPDTDDARWRAHLDIALAPDRTLATTPATLTPQLSLSAADDDSYGVKVEGERR